MEALQPFITGVPIETLSIPKELNFEQITIKKNQTYTVPVGKKLLLTYYKLTSYALTGAVTGTTGVLDLYNPGGALQERITVVNVPAGAPANSEYVSELFYQYPREIPENSQLQMINTDSAGDLLSDGIAYGFLFNL